MKDDPDWGLEIDDWELVTRSTQERRTAMGRMYGGGVIVAAGSAVSKLLQNGIYVMENGFLVMKNGSLVRVG